MAFPLALSALGAGILDLVENVFLWFAVDGDAEGAWPFAAAATWGKFLIVVLVTLYVVGGLLSLLLRADVRRVLREADENPGAPPSRTMNESRYGLAFSGGGVRAASITLGALQALEREGTMGWDDADHVTSVSGGSYMTGAWSLARSTPADGMPDVCAETVGNRRHPAGTRGASPAREPRLPALQQPSRRGERHARPHRRDRARDARRAVAGRRSPRSSPGCWSTRWSSWGCCGRSASSPAGSTAGTSGCPARTGATAAPCTFEADQGCLDASDRLVTPIVIWLGLGLGFVLVWVLAAKAAEIIGRADPPSWLLGPKYLGYGGLGVAAALGLVLGALPWAIGTLWESISANSLRTDLVAVAGAVGSTTAVFRLLRKPLARLAPWIGGLLFAMVLLFLLCRWTLDAMAADPDAAEPRPAAARAWRHCSVVHFSGAPEFWSLAAFYRGKLRSAFGTYRVAYPRGVRARAYANDDRAPEGERVEPSLSQLPVRDPATGAGTPADDLRLRDHRRAAGPHPLRHPGAERHLHTHRGAAVRTAGGERAVAAVRVHDGRRWMRCARG